MRKGMVTTATVRMPRSWAMLAMTGEAPVPVPPPIPAAMKSIFTPEVSSSERSCSSLPMASSRPRSALLPAPRPGPICILLLTLQLANAAASVLHTTKFTPVMPIVCMWFTALPPAPPTPITMIIDSASSCRFDFGLFATSCESKSSAAFIVFILLLFIVQSSSKHDFILTN